MSIMESNISELACRLQAFSAVLGRHRSSQHVEQISVADVESVVNNGAPVPYSKVEIEKLLQVCEFFNYNVFDVQSFKRL